MSSGTVEKDDTRETHWCHQCRAKKHAAQCLNIVSRKAGGRGKLCRKRYCENCLSRFYNEDIRRVMTTPEWKCPSCRNECSCTICTKEPDLDPKPKELRRRDPVTDATFLRTFSLLDDLIRCFKATDGARDHLSILKNLDAARSSVQCALVMFKELREEDIATQASGPTGTTVTAKAEHSSSRDTT
eukprot:GILK01014706.1.p1 GENE.GILK01014706.1~~GILK01014706.1.p1  ORF type:complete len:194 (+),score=20.08 GILK01014706.1:27-584(+)